MLIPFDRFVALQTPATLAQLGRSRRFRALAGESERLARLDLPVLIGEGTNRGWWRGLLDADCCCRRRALIALAGS